MRHNTVELAEAKSVSGITRRLTRTCAGFGTCPECGAPSTSRTLGDRIFGSFSHSTRWPLCQHLPLRRLWDCRKSPLARIRRAPLLVLQIFPMCSIAVHLQKLLLVIKGRAQRASNQGQARPRADTIIMNTTGVEWKRTRGMEHNKKQGGE